MPANAFPTGVEYFRFLPEIILTLAGVAIMLLEAVFTNDDQRKIFGPLSVVALFAALLASISAAGDPGAAFSNMLIIDGFASFFRALVIGIGIIAILSSTGYLRQERMLGGEYHALVLFSIVGQCVMVSANWVEQLPTVVAIEDTLVVQMDLSMQDPRCAIWGMDHLSTIRAVETFIAKGYLDTFVRGVVAGLENQINPPM